MATRGRAWCCCWFSATGSRYAAWLCVSEYVCTYVYAWVTTWACLWICLRMYIYIYIHTGKHSCFYQTSKQKCAIPDDIIYMYTYIHIHTYIHYMAGVWRHCHGTRKPRVGSTETQASMFWREARHDTRRIEHVVSGIMSVCLSVFFPSPVCMRSAVAVWRGFRHSAWRIHSCPACLLLVDSRSLTLPLSLSLTHKHTHTHSLSLSVSRSLTHTLSLSLSHTHSLSLSLSLSLSQFLFYTHYSLSLSQFLSHTLSLSVSLTHSLHQSPPPSLSLLSLSLYALCTQENRHGARWTEQAALAINVCVR